MEEGEFRLVFALADESGRAVKDGWPLDEVDRLGVLEDDVVDVGGVDAAAEVRGDDFDVLAMTDDRHGVAGAIKPHSSGGGGLDVRTLRLLSCGEAANQFDGRQLAPTAHEP